jgi:hypothetical protein
LLKNGYRLPVYGFPVDCLKVLAKIRKEMMQLRCQKSILIETEGMKFRKNIITKTDFINGINTFGLK